MLRRKGRDRPGCRSDACLCERSEGERKTKAIKAAEEGISLAQEAIEQSIAVQKTALDYSANQTKAAFESAKKQFGYAGTPAAAAADSVQRGVEVVIGAQKDMLDVLKTPIQILH